MFDLKNIFGKKAKKVLLSKDEIAEFLKINPEALIKFEESYKNHVLGKKMLSDNFFAINAKQIVEEKKKRLISDITAEQGDIDAIWKLLIFSQRNMFLSPRKIWIKFRKRTVRN